MEIKSSYRTTYLLSKKSKIELTSEGCLISVNEFLPDKVVTLIKENMIFCEFYEGIEKYESLDLIADIFFADTGQPEFVSFRFYNNKPIKIPDFISSCFGK